MRVTLSRRILIFLQKMCVFLLHMLWYKLTTTINRYILINPTENTRIVKCTFKEQPVTYNMSFLC